MIPEGSRGQGAEDSRVRDWVSDTWMRETISTAGQHTEAGNDPDTDTDLDAEKKLTVLCRGWNLAPTMQA